MAAGSSSDRVGRAQPPYHRRWWILGVLCGSVALIGLSYTILYVAVPELISELGAGSDEVQWIVAIYSIVFAGLVVAAGSVGDRFGRRRMLLAGLVLFGVMSAIGARSDSPAELMAARALMGVGAAMIMPGTLSTLSVVFPGDERVRAVGIWAGVGGVGFVFGPLVAGVLLTHFWWGSTLLFVVPVVLVMIVAVILLVPESRDPGATPLDLPGAALSMLAVGALVYVFVEGPESGWTSTAIVAGATVAVLAGTGFWYWERRSPHPMLDVRLFSRAAFTVPALVITVGNLAVYGVQFLVPQYLRFVEDVSPIVVGGAISVTALTWSASAIVIPRYVRRWGEKPVIVGGMLAVSAGLAVICAIGTGASLVVVVSGFALVGVGMGSGTTPATSMLIGSLPPEKAGVGSAMNDVTREVGGALGVAVMGSVVSVVYRPRVSDAEAALPSTVHASATALDRARDNLGDALALTDRLGAAGLDLADASLSAFTHGTRLAVAVGAALVLATGTLAMLWLPRRR